MKLYLISLILFFLVSCTPSFYLSEQIKYIPRIDLNAKQILIANNSLKRLEKEYYEKCIKGVEIDLQIHSKVNICEEDFVMNYYDKDFLIKQAEMHSLDGFLFLTKLDFYYEFYNVPTKILGKRDNRMPEPFYRIYNVYEYETRLFCNVTSNWEYHDLNSDHTFKFRIINDKVHEFDTVLNDPYTYIEDNPQFLNKFFFENGVVTARRLLE